MQTVACLFLKVVKKVVVVVVVGVFGSSSQVVHSME